MKVCEGYISSRFGYRVHPVTGERNKFHNGVDIAAPIGAHVLSPVDAIVTDVSENSIGGKRVSIRSGNKDYIFLHLSEQCVTKGAPVRKKSLLARVGATGRVTGPHLHYSVRVDGHYVDPEPYIMIQ